MKPPSQVLIANYTLLCLSALLIMLLTLIERLVWPSWAMLPFVVGALGVVLRWRTGVGLLLVSLAVVVHSDAVWLMMRGAWRPETPLHLSNLILCATVLAFVIAQLRLVSLTRNILPRDPREEIIRPWDAETSTLVTRPPHPSRKRLGDDSSATAEFLQLLFTLPLWLVVGGLLAITLLNQYPDLPLNFELWRLIIFIWVVALVLVVIWVLFAQWRFRTMSPAEALMVLQDEQWQETRNEQRLLGRWLSWARRRRRRKEKP
jgi:hypothetical protein